jgi:hypothetical protein
MKWKQITRIGTFGIMAMWLGSAVWSSAAATSGKVTDESQKAARLLRDIQADSVQVRAAAARLYHMTASSNAAWIDYDRQWNEIKPFVEDMQIKLDRLENMQATISPAERKAVDQSKLLVQEIRSRTRGLRTLLDKPGVQPTDARFKAYARSLRNEAVKLETTSKVS